MSHARVVQGPTLGCPIYHYVGKLYDHYSYSLDHRMPVPDVRVLPGRTPLVATIDPPVGVNLQMRRPMKSSELVARHLVDYIVENDLPEGTALPSEREMAEELEVGRATVREALRLLETRGAISIRKGARGGPIVRRPKAADVSEALSLALQFLGGVVGDVFEAREMLECVVAERAATEISDVILGEMDASVGRSKRGIADTATFLAETQLFHRLLNQAANNVAIEVLNQTLHAVTNTAVSHVELAPEHRKKVVAAHENVLAALKARDPELAATAMRNHVRDSKRYWNRAAGDLGRMPVRWLQAGAS